MDIQPKDAASQATRRWTPEHSSMVGSRALSLWKLLDRRSYYLSLLRRAPFGVYRRLVNRKAKAHRILFPYVSGKSGLEIGGPSPIFSRKGQLPVYETCRSIDSCDFAEQTIWTEEHDPQLLGAPLARRYVAEASDLWIVPDAAYDFLLASHVLEHIANPLRALREWRRVLVPGGVAVVIVPDKRNTFDRKRPYTSFEHMESDFMASMEEDDLTHVPEALALHDYGMELPGPSRYEIQGRFESNPRFRSVHHHVFNLETLSRALRYSDMQPLSISYERPFHIVAVAQRGHGG